MEDELRRRDAILEAVGFAAERLLGEVVGWGPSVQAVLRRLGEATGTSHVYVEPEVDDAGGAGGRRWEWLRPGVWSPDGPEVVDRSGSGPMPRRWAKALSSAEAVWGLARKLPEEERGALRLRGVGSFLAVPIFVEGRWWGQIVFETREERDWKAAEVGALRAAAGTLAAALRRRRTEEELRRREEEYRAIFELAGVGKAQTDPATGAFLRVNPKLSEITGYAAEELLGRPIWELVHGDDRERDRGLYRQLLEGAIPEYSVEQRYRRRDGRIVWVSVNTTVSRDPQGRPVRTVATIQDVTERRRAEEALKESEERFRSAFEATPIGMALVRLDGRWVDVNRPFLDLVGYSSEEMLSLTFQDITHPDDLGADLANMRRLLAGEIPSYRMEKRYIHADGHVLWVLLSASLVRDQAGTPLYGIAQVEDITQRKQDAERLLHSEALYRAVIEQAKENIFLVDAGSRRIVETNPAFRQTFGYTEEDLPTLTIDDLTAGDSSGEGVFTGQHRYRRRNSSLIDVDVSASTVRRDDRETLCVVAHDVTERARVQGLLERRLAALARLSASLSLDLSAQPALDGLAHSVMTASTAVACTVVLSDGDGGEPRLVGAPSLASGHAEALAAAYRDASSPFGELRHGRPRLIRDLRRRFLTADPGPVRDFVRSGNWDVVYSVPMVRRDRTLGVIHFHYPHGEEPGEDEQAFLSAVAEQTAVAVENARLVAEARGVAALEERQRLARELHDSVSQVLYGIALGARTARELVGTDSAPVSEPLEYVLAQADAGLAEMRALIFELRPESLATEGLVTALEQQTGALEARHGVRVDAALIDEPQAPLPVKEALYRIAQEALHNTVKHAAAHRVGLRLSEAGQHLELEVTDDGRGFDADAQFPGHLGLRSMRERAAEFGGHVAVTSAPGRGTLVRATIPLPDRPAEGVASG